MSPSKLRRGTLAVWLCLVVCATALADSPDDRPVGLKGAIERGAAFLAKDAVRWKEEHKCASCHHAALVVWSLNEVKGRSHAVDEAVLADMTKWLTEAGEGKTGVPRPEGRPKALNTKAVYFALGLLSDPAPDEAIKAALARFGTTMHEDQLDDGSWAAWPETRPPLFGPSDQAMTTLATLALNPDAKGDQPAVERAAKWLASRPEPTDHQAAALRLILWKRLGKTEAEWLPLAQWIVERQAADGGWSQTTNMPSDAFASGQSLYALALADAVRYRPEIERGQEFLIKSQQDDGSWTMTSRPSKPDDTGAKNLVPIKGAAAAWAVLGLAHSGS